MKERRVTVTIELNSEAPLKEIKKGYVDGPNNYNNYLEDEILKVQVNAIQDKKKR